MTTRLKTSAERPWSSEVVPGRRSLGALALGTVAMALSFVGCGDGGGSGTTTGKLARLEAFDDGLALPVDGTIGVSNGTLAVGEEGYVSELRLINTGDADLEITNVVIESTPPGVFRLAGSPQGGEQPTLPVSIAPQAALEGTRSLYYFLMYKRPESGVVASAKIKIASNSVSSSGVKQPEIVFNVTLNGLNPVIQIQPSVVNFGTVQQGKTGLNSINILNLGNDTLLVDSFTLTGHPNIELVIGSTQYKVSAETAQGIVLEEPIAVEPGTTFPVSVRYSATDAAEAKGQVVFFSNDPGATSGTLVPIQANVGGPCVSVNPRRVAFGGKLVGKTARVDVEVTSCGDQPLEITEIGLLPDGTSPEFTLDLSALPGTRASNGQLGPSDVPLVLQPNQKATITVEYFPEDISPIDPVSNQPTYDVGSLRIRSNSFQAELLTEISGFGVEVECPTAVIIVQEGEEVIPQTKLHLIGAQSYAATGTIQSYTWEVDQPIGSQSVFAPSGTVADPTFEVNVAGTYTFRLNVKDSSGTASCVPATATVFVNPDQAIHVELLWDTPNDPNQTDTGPVAGADLDLHFTHPNARGDYDGDNDGKMDGWFDIPFDCFWFNKHPDWGSSNPAIDDNPSLDRDDTDGAGPENVNMNSPESGKSYKVGVHYWKDHGFGSSFATLRVYIFANLVFELSDVELVDKDMWTVTNIAWPPSGTPPQVVKVCKGTFQTCSADNECTGGAKCGYRISPNYSHPFFPSD